MIIEMDKCLRPECHGHQQYTGFPIQNWFDFETQFIEKGYRRIIMHICVHKLHLARCLSLFREFLIFMHSGLCLFPISTSLLQLQNQIRMFTQYTSNKLREGKSLKFFFACIEQLFRNPHQLIFNIYQTQIKVHKP